MEVGFIGVGNMGQPMCRNLLKSGRKLVVWNRDQVKASVLVELGAVLANSPLEVLQRCRVVFVMLASDEALRSVLPPELFSKDGLAPTLIVNMGTHDPDVSLSMEESVRSNGHQFVEAPVSGSRVPAEQGTLVCMLAGEDSAVVAAAEQVQPMCSQSFKCGAIPGALSMKFAINSYMIGMITALGESFHLAKAAGLDLNTFHDVLSAGPMNSDIMRGKLAKLLAADLSPQAKISDVAKNTTLVDDHFRRLGVEAPLFAECHRYFASANAKGLGEQDMIAAFFTEDLSVTGIVS